MAGNVYFALTRVFNEHGATVALASGQAVVHAYALAAEPYLEAFGRLASAQRRLPQAHPGVMSLADRHLPETIDIPGGGHADAE